MAHGAPSLYGFSYTTPFLFTGHRLSRLHRSATLISVGIGLDLMPAIPAPHDQNANPKRFVWTKSAGTILAKLDRLPVSSECV
jgi:hypothetical protein